MESTGAGLLAGLNAVRLLRGEDLVVLPRETMMGALTHHITTAAPETFQPMNANFGIIPPLPGEQSVHKKDRKAWRSNKVQEAFARWLASQ